jgi:hypothetical protein
MNLTLTDVLNSQQQLLLYGQRLDDLVPRGHLGLAMDPEGPVCFASVRCYVLCGRAVELETPIIVSVYGEGAEPGEADTVAQNNERVWAGRAGDMAVRLDTNKAALLGLLQPQPASAWRN